MLLSRYFDRQTDVDFAIPPSNALSVLRDNAKLSPFFQHIFGAIDGTPISCCPSGLELQMAREVGLLQKMRCWSFIEHAGSVLLIKCWRYYIRALD
ncbi:hypothetical protein CPB83DRAFT_849770 [Crepidotus variabilis]|uniref:Uncharacterized protein n=1 Tax=Crepidotus variabilis TaxID=179855 RepID=A0A9P6JRJ4_9AGAR|nr:hypothetical protein CPB83DRAFT_849770 [Crepidotus variabilis]